MAGETVSLVYPHPALHSRNMRDSLNACAPGKAFDKILERQPWNIPEESVVIYLAPIPEPSTPQLAPGSETTFVAGD